MRNYTTALLQASIEHEGKGHQFKADSRRYKAFVQAIDELSAQLLRDKSAFEKDVYNRLVTIKRELEFEIDAIEDNYNDRI